MNQINDMKTAPDLVFLFYNYTTKGYYKYYRRK